MQNKKSTHSLPCSPKGAIPINRHGSEQLAPVIRDLADLLAEVAVRRLKKTYEKAHEALE